MDEKQIMADLFEGSRLSSLVYASDWVSTNQIAYLKTLLMAVSEVTTIDANEKFLLDFIKEESVTLLKLYHGAKEGTVRYVIDFNDDILIADIPVDQTEESSVTLAVELDRALSVYYKGERYAWLLSDEVVDSFEIMMKGKGKFYEMQLPSKNQHKTSLLATEKLQRPGDYLQQKLTELIRNDPLMAIDARLASGDVMEALQIIEEFELSVDDFKNNIARTIASGLQPKYISTEDMASFDATGLLDGLEDKEIDHLLAEKLSEAAIWGEYLLDDRFKILVAGSLPEKINRLLNSAYLLSSDPIPPDLLAWTQNEILNGHIAESSDLPKTRLKL